jgi:hypothetical protein
MTDISQDDHELIRRYLANRLSDTEELMVTTRIIQDPQFRNEVEVTAAFREGIRELENRGKLSPLLESRTRRWPRAQLALAAAVAIVAMGGLISLLLDQRRDEGAPTVITETLRFETTRGDGALADVTWHQSGRPVRLELRFDVGPDPAGSYLVTLERVSGGAIVSMADRPIPVSSGGEVVHFLDGALLEPGDYEIRLEPQPVVVGDGIVNYRLTVLGSPDASS